MTISRRDFVKTGGLALAGAAFAPHRLPPVRLARGRPILVCVFQRGAVDGLSTIVPHGDPVYYRERPRIAVPQRVVLDLDGYFGLHPRLAALKPLWDSKCLAAIHAIGPPSVVRSHFDAQRVMDGWLNRYCRPGRTHDATRFRALLPPPANGADYPQSKLGKALVEIAQLIKADVGLQVASADVTGWDTHVNQGATEGPLAERLGELGQALAAFTRDLGERMRDVVVLTISEFGRTVQENGCSGTDHGHATAMLVLGGPVNGGRVLGKWPGLEPAQRVEGQDLAVTTDFRDLVAELLVRHLGTRDLSAIFPGFVANSERFPGAIRG